MFNRRVTLNAKKMTLNTETLTLNPLGTNKCRSPRQTKFSVIKEFWNSLPTIVRVQINFRPIENPLDFYYSFQLLAKNFPMLVTKPLGERC